MSQHSNKIGGFSSHIGYFPPKSQPDIHPQKHKIAYLHRNYPFRAIGAIYTTAIALENPKRNQ